MSGDSIPSSESVVVRRPDRHPLFGHDLLYSNSFLRGTTYGADADGSADDVLPTMYLSDTAAPPPADTAATASDAAEPEGMAPRPEPVVPRKRDTTAPALESTAPDAATPAPDAAAPAPDAATPAPDAAAPAPDAATPAPDAAAPAPDAATPAPDAAAPAPDAATPAATESWGGDPDASKPRHKPMEVSANEDGSSTVIVKPGDTPWDIAKRVLQAQGISKPTPQQILDELHHLEDVNGKHFGIIRPGDPIQIGADDTGEVRRANGEQHQADDGKGNWSTVRAQDGSGISVHAGNDGKPDQITVVDGDEAHTRHKYEKNEKGEWIDQSTGKPVTVEIDEKAGTVTITDEAGNKRTEHKNGTVEETKDGKHTITKLDGTKYEEQADHSWKRSDCAAVASVKVNEKGEIEEGAVTKATDKGTDTEYPNHTKHHVDANGDETVTTPDGKIYSRKKGEGWKDPEGRPLDRVIIDEQGNVSEVSTTIVEGTPRKIYVVKKDSNGQPIDIVVDNLPCTNSETHRHYVRKPGTENEWQEFDGVANPTPKPVTVTVDDKGTITIKSDEGVKTIDRDHKVSDTQVQKIAVQPKPPSGQPVDRR